MSLDLLAQERGINIKDLTEFESPRRKDLPFDQEHDITQSDKDRIREYLTSLAAKKKDESNAWSNEENYAEYLLREAAIIKQLLPTFHPETIIPEDRKQVARQYITRLLPELAARLLLNFQIVYPEEDTEITEDRLESIRFMGGKELPGLFASPYIPISHALTKLEALNAIKKNNPPYIGKNYWKLVKNELDQSIQKPFRFVRTARYAKTLFPDKFQEYPLPSNFWSKARAELQRLRENDSATGMEQFLKFALNLKVLAAQDAKITPHGLEFVTPPSRSDIAAIPEPPSVRKF